MSSVIEIVEFKTVPGVGSDTFVSAAQEANAFLAKQPGFIRRHLARRDDGSWIDLVEWSSLEAAQAAASAFLAAPEAASFMTKIAEGARMSHASIRLSS